MSTSIRRFLNFFAVSNKLFLSSSLYLLLFRIITNSLLCLITSLWHHYYCIISALLSHYYIIITSFYYYYTISTFLLPIITFAITSLLRTIIILWLHTYYPLLYLQLLRIITSSLLHHYYVIITSLLRHYYVIITSLLRHYHVVITSLLRMGKSWHNYYIITRYAKSQLLILRHYYALSRLYYTRPIFTHYYMFQSPKLADVPEPTSDNHVEYGAFVDQPCVARLKKHRCYSLVCELQAWQKERSYCW